jgi:transcription initiation factor IIE alpha subunit
MENNMERVCPQCGSDLEEFEEEPDVNIQGGMYCTNPDCDYVDEITYEED